MCGNYCRSGTPVPIQKMALADQVSLCFYGESRTIELTTLDQARSARARACLGYPFKFMSHVVVLHRRSSNCIRVDATLVRCAMTGSGCMLPGPAARGQAQFYMSG